MATPVFFAPDIDNGWNAAPGSLIAMTNFAPLQNGNYGSIGTSNYFGSATLTGSDHHNAFMFRLQNNSVLFLSGRADTIDKYDSAGSRTNIGTGYTTFVRWSMAAWGDLIIATNGQDAVQASTAGAAMAPLGGSPPTAYLVAANQNFVMLGNYGTTLDGVWWSALQNPLSWTASIATQAGNYRLLDTPGPITDLVAYRDTFVAFKANSMYVGTYQGPPYVWGWQLVSNKVGAIGISSAVECDGKLYFFHTSGFYEFDGNSLRQIGVPVTQSFLAEAGYIAETSAGVAGTSSATYTFSQPLGLVSAAADDIDGVVWWEYSYKRTSDNANFSFMYGYNVRTGRWGRALSIDTGIATGSAGVALVRATSADIKDFLSTDKTTRLLSIWNDTGGTTLRSINYPAATTEADASNYGCSFTPGVIGNIPGQHYLSRMYLRHVPGTSALAAQEVTGVIDGYINEAKTVTLSSAIATWNAAQATLDFSQNAEFVQPRISYTLGEKIVLGGVDMMMGKVGAR